MAKHTEGPWHVMDTPATREIFNDCPVIVSEHVEDAIIATIGEDVPESEGNGHLLAAAPDLLAALKWCVNHLQQIEKRDYPGVEEKQRRFSSTATGLAAITKAEGRAC